jgi:hypothetical protein
MVSVAGSSSRVEGDIRTGEHGKMGGSSGAILYLFAAGASPVSFVLWLPGKAN